jgi:hypothetical protein
MKNHNLSAHIVWATLIIMAMLAYAGCYNDAPNPWYNNQENTGGNNSNKTPGTQQGGSGGTQQNGAGGGTQQDPNYKVGFAVNFNMPKDWRYNMEGANSEDQLVLDQPSSDGIKPYVMMDLHWSDEGDNSKAKESAQKDHNERFPWIDEFNNNKEYKPYYKEMELNGTKIYISGDINHYWGFPSWSESIWFAHDGVVYSVDLDDVVEKHLDAVKTVVETIKRKN